MKPPGEKAQDRPAQSYSRVEGAAMMASRYAHAKQYRASTRKNPRRVFISGQRRSVFGAIERDLRRRSAIEP